MSCTFDGVCNLTLMVSAGAGNAAGEDFSALCHTAAETGSIFIVHVLNAVSAELADFFTGFAVSSVVTIHSHGYHLLIFGVFRKEDHYR
jgi:hypothetical protein